MSKVTVCWWGDNIWKKQLLKSANLRRQMWHCVFCPPVGHRQVQQHFSWIGLFSQNSRKVCFAGGGSCLHVECICTLLEELTAEYAVMGARGEGQSKRETLALMLMLQLRATVLNIQPHCYPFKGSFPSVWDQLGLLMSLQRQHGPQMGHSMEILACQSLLWE